MALFRRQVAYDRTRLLKQAGKAVRKGGRRNLRRAVALYRQVLDVEPDDPDLLRRVAPLLVATRRREEASAAYRGAIARLSALGFRERAVGVCREATGLLPRDAALWRTLAELELARGRRHDALAALRAGRAQLRGRRYRAQAAELLFAARKIDASDLEIGLDLAALMARSGARRRALAMLEQLARTHASQLRRIRALQFRIAPGVRSGWLWLQSAIPAR